MEYTPAATPPALSVTFATLSALFTTLPDPRRAQGRQFPLAALRTLAVAAILANHLSVLAIAEWGAAQGDASRRALGFTGHTMPHQTTLHRLFARLDAYLLATTLSRAVRSAMDEREAAPGMFLRGAQGVAVDGKAHRGRLAGHPLTTCPIHMLSAVCHETGLVLAQLPVTASGDKPAAELATAPALIACLDWQGRVLTGDALYCQRGLCQQVVDAGGDYLVLVKGNQPELHRDLATLFAHRADTALNAASLPAPDMRHATTDDGGHGRVERRTLIASTDLNDYLDWPALAQVFTVERVWQERGVTKRSVRYGITSLAGSDGRRNALADAQARPLADRERVALGERRDTRGGSQPDTQRTGARCAGDAARHRPQSAAQHGLSHHRRSVASLLPLSRCPPLPARPSPSSARISPSHCATATTATVTNQAVA